jgi:hypothetical protein
MGGQPGMQEDLFGKLEGMREVISEVNTQFKDPVRGNFWYTSFDIELLCRRRRPLSAFASPSSCRSMKPSDWCKS